MLFRFIFGNRLRPDFDRNGPPVSIQPLLHLPSDTGGIMFETVLKRLCPCYFTRKEANDMTGGPNKTSEGKNTISERNETDPTTLNTTTSNSSSETPSNWKGTVNLVQPQPIYAFPSDLKKSKKNQRNLLKPPLYWKKTMKNFLTEGPPVFQDTKNKKSPRDKKTELQKDDELKGSFLKHSETIADISSVTSPSTIDVRWLKSQSLDNVSLRTSASDKKPKTRKRHSMTARDRGDGPHIGNKKSDLKDNEWSCRKCQVLPDISHGVILFTAAYFSEKKTCLININRLENLSKKGREGISYYSVVKLAVLPSEKYIKCTKILSNCSNPEVKQDFSFSVKELTGRVLRLSVFDASLQKQHEAVGHALLTLEDIAFNQPKKYKIKLYRRTQPHVCPGNLLLSLKYYPEEDKFTILVDRAKNLSLQKDKNVKLNTYVKVSLYSYGEKVKTKKSMIIMDSRDPKYNSTFTFQVRKDQIEHLSVTITVRLKGFVNDIAIGRLNFGPFFKVDDGKLTPWGRVFLKRELVSYWFRMYL